MPKMMKYAILSDFDDTITTINVLDTLYEMFGGSSTHYHMERWRRGEISTMEELEQIFSTVKSTRYEMEALLRTVELDPGFTDAQNHEFTLDASSELIDRGTFLTRAVGSGSGTLLTVQDARYFYDGFGIEEELGDFIQLEGQVETARVVGIDYEANTLTLDGSLTWSDAQGVALAYQGDVPDIGAFETGP